MAISKRQMVDGSNKGFTLIEMLVVFAVIGSLTAVGVNSFFSYSKGQIFRTSVSEVAHTLNTAKTRAVSQVKPTNCAVNQTLRMYQVSFTVPGSTYRLQVVCDGNTYTLQTKTLPANVTFQEGSAATVAFAVRTGVVAQERTVTIIDNDNTTSSVSIDTVGNVSIE